MHKLSKFVVIGLVVCLLGIRLYYIKWNSEVITNVLTWDAFGYYLILPATFIYDDIKQGKWVDDINAKYRVTQNVYQLSDLPNGNKAMKYLLGISILYSPFFIAGHLSAGLLHFPQDGFSAPYQIAISIASLFYAFIGLWLVRLILLRYVNELITSITLLLLVLATNYPQYVAVEGGMSHGYIFTLYALLLWLTIRWHERPTPFTALCIGLIIGLGVISRPTEAVMIFIPLLFKTQTKEVAKEKWRLVRQHKSHIAVALAGGILGILPQLIYWKAVTGSWIYDVGSKFSFFNPHWQVLFGWEKGWFIYTPIAVLMIAGIFCMRKNDWFKAVVCYALINIWIIIAWSDWHYGASYSARALVQSYAVMAVPLAFGVNKLIGLISKPVALLLFSFLCVLNLFQVWQYNKTILHYRDMNFKYYKAIFLNPSPTPEQMSLLDTDEYISNQNKYEVVANVPIDTQVVINAASNPRIPLYEKSMEELLAGSLREPWLRVSLSDSSAWGAFESFLVTEAIYADTTKRTACRLHNGMSGLNKWNTTAYYYKLPIRQQHGEVRIYVETSVVQDIYLKEFEIEVLDVKN